MFGPLLAIRQGSQTDPIFHLARLLRAGRFQVCPSIGDAILSHEDFGPEHSPFRALPNRLRHLVEEALDLGPFPAIRRLPQVPPKHQAACRQTAGR